MDTRKITTELRLNQWAQVIQDRIASGDSIRSYCKATGIKECVYFYWQKKLREAACEKLIETTMQNDLLQPSNTSNKTPPPANGWAICAVEESPPQNEKISIEIGKCRITVQSDTNEALLTKTCRMLMTLC